MNLSEVFRHPVCAECLANGKKELAQDGHNVHGEKGLPIKQASAVGPILLNIPLTV